jgi:hypothetical protein
MGVSEDWENHISCSTLSRGDFECEQVGKLFCDEIPLKVFIPPKMTISILMKIVYLREAETLPPWI